MNTIQKEIYLAGGCFWGVQEYFRQVPGVIKTQAGYANGTSQDTDYQSISRTDHAETVYIAYDPSRISLTEILMHFFRIIDPIAFNKQGNDVGRQYRTGIYHVDPSDLATIHTIMQAEQKKYYDPIAVEAEPLKNYVAAEEYHQDYLEKNPLGYCHINLTMAKEPLYKEEEGK